MADLTKGEVKTILVVDDEPGMVEIVQINLEAEGYRVISAGDGPTALLKVRGEEPNLVLLDVMMPGMSGWQVLEQMAADPATASIPVVMLTVLAENNDVVQGLEKGAVEFITKPFDLDHLCDTIKLILEQADKRTQEARRRQSMSEHRRLMKPLHELFPDKHEKEL